MKKAFLIALASSLITAAGIKAAPALAETPGAAAPVNVSIVRTADIDLRTAAGQRILQHRLAAAAREVCGRASDVDVRGKNEVRQCRVETLAQAQAGGEGLRAAAERGAVIALTAAR